jgi:hypothetical protein
MVDKTILITGDCVINHHVYENHTGDPCTKIVEHQGGVVLLHKLLTEVSKKVKEGSFSVSLGTNGRLKKYLPHSFSLWYPVTVKGESATKIRQWEFSRSLGDPCKIYEQMPGKMAVGSSSGEVLVIHDAGLYFRHGANRHLWPDRVSSPKPEEIDRVVLTMSSPLAHGDLWRELSTHFRKKLIVIVSLRDIVEEEAGITVGISWEKTLEELTFELLHNGAISDLLKCGDLIVKIGTAGALWVNSEGGASSFTAIFDPTRLDTGISYETDEVSLCFAAAIATRLMREKTDAVLMGIHSGLATITKLVDLGYIQVSNAPPSFPYDGITALLLSEPSGFTRIPVPADRNGGEYPWSIMGNDLSTNLGIARRVALFGPRALGSIPYSTFGKLTVVDRNEIESLCGLKQLIVNYVKQEKPERPLSIAVFGAPGSGKSFGVKQIGKEILGPDCIILEFNLSQFAGPEELVGALHQVRDRVLEGTIPMVFWDEFDSKGYQWLQYLLAPMQDGKFQEGQLTHLIGKSIFIFAGGTSQTMKNFVPSQNNVEATEKFKMVKGPDFVSRLNGFLSVLGPNPRQRFDEKRQRWVEDEVLPDNCYPIRRALLIRSVSKLKPDQQLSIDQGILTALLEIGRYRHGARSLETVVNLSRHGTHMLVRSDLPPEDQLSLHVDYGDFMTLVKRDLPFRMNADELATAIHDNFIASSKEKGTTIEYGVEFDRLPPDIKASNIAAAARIPVVLSLVGLRVRPASLVPVKSDPRIKKIIEDNVELLAEAEHNGWMEEKLKNGWNYGPERNNDLKLHPSMVPYGNLKEEDREKGRDAVRKYPQVAARAGYEVVKTMPEPASVKKQRKGK